MSGTEKAFLGCVFCAAAVFCGVTLKFSGRPESSVRGPSAGRRGAPSAGEPRDMDAARFRDLIRRGFMSGHEAKYYKKLRSPERPGEPPESGNRRGLKKINER